MSTFASSPNVNASSHPAIVGLSSPIIIDSSPIVVSLVPAERYYKMDRQEDLASESGYDYDEDMGDLSDSPSSHPSSSRPTTPHGHQAAHVRTRASASPPAESTPFSIAHKAERILGLTPGTLPHARAALENARDEVRRTADIDSPPPPTPYTVPEMSSPPPPATTGMRGRLDRAVKAMSVTFPRDTKIAGVVVGTGGKAEEKRRERRRRAADGVIYWQKEVARLEAEEKGRVTIGRKSRR